MRDRAEGLGEHADYRSYLLRLWRVGEGKYGWQASLESPRDCERQGFSGLEAMFDFLRRQAAQPGNRNDRDEGRG